VKELARRVGLSLWQLQQIERGEAEADPRVRQALEQQVAWSPPSTAHADTAKDLGRQTLGALGKRSEQSRRGATARWQRESAPAARSGAGRSGEAEVVRLGRELAAERREKAQATKEYERRIREAESASTETAAEARGTASALSEAQADLQRREGELARRKAETEEAASALSKAQADLQRREGELARRKAATEDELGRRRAETVIESEAEERAEVTLESPAPSVQSKPAPMADASGEGPLTLGRATFDDFRELGMSITQAKRVLKYRDELGELDSLDDLDRVPGFSIALREDIKRQLKP
jgi:colicin import membrane protein